MQKYNHKNTTVTAIQFDGENFEAFKEVEFIERLMSKSRKGFRFLTNKGKLRKVHLKQYLVIFEDNSFLIRSEAEFLNKFTIESETETEQG